jgi:signal transduction histidine kinase
VVTGTRAAAAAEVRLRVDGDDVAVASYPGQVETPDRVVPIGDDGTIALALHRGLRLRPHEERLLQDLASHAALMVRNARLAAELARHVELVAEQADELRRSRARVVMAQDAERVRLERDLHDGAQQELIAVLLGLGPAEDLDELAALLDSTSRTMRELCDGDLPATLVQGGIGAGLAAALPAVRRSGLDVSIEAPAGPRPPLDLEAAVYYCCQEALQNAAKHARAGQVAVRLAFDGGELTFEVVDDGAGFDPHGRTATSGLDNMAERLAVLGGTLTLESEPGGGTRVRGRVPTAARPVEVAA